MAVRREDSLEWILNGRWKVKSTLWIGRFKDFETLTWSITTNLEIGIIFIGLVANGMKGNLKVLSTLTTLGKAEGDYYWSPV